MHGFLLLVYKNSKTYVMFFADAFVSINHTAVTTYYVIMREVINSALRYMGRSLSLFKEEEN